MLGWVRCLRQSLQKRCTKRRKYKGDYLARTAGNRDPVHEVCTPHRRKTRTGIIAKEEEADTRIIAKEEEADRNNSERGSRHENNSERRRSRQE